MSLSAATRLVQYTLSGAGQTLPITFKFFDATSILVTKTVAGVDTVLVNPTDYSVTGGVSGGIAATGNVVMVAGVAGDIITIEGAEPQTQLTDLTQSGPLPAVTLTAMNDRLTILAQQLKTRLDRCLAVPNTNAALSVMTLNARKGTVPGFDAVTGALTLFSLSAILALAGTVGPNLFCAGPVSGGAATPTFRAISPTDIAGALVTTFGSPPIIGGAVPNSATFTSLQATTFGVSGASSVAALTVSGVLSLSAGAVGAPAIQFGGDATSGFYRSAANQVACAISGANVLVAAAAGLTISGVFTSSGNGDVGLGSGTFSILSLGRNPTANSASVIRFLGSNTQTNWQLTHNTFVAGAFEITPSTAGGGTSFTTPLVTLATSGAKLAGTLTLAPVARTTPATPHFLLTIPADTALTAATESIGYQHATGSRQWAATGTVALQRETFFAGPTYTSASASQTFTDVFTAYFTPPIAGSNAIFTRGHTVGIVDATSAASSITGGFIVATTLGTAATSVGIGGGNVNAGGLITGGTITSTGAFTASSTSTFTGTMTVNNAATFNGTNATTALTITNTARTSGILPYFKINLPADTGLTAATEAPGFQTVTATRTWATTGTVATQREYLFVAPTYASASASQTFTTAATVAISAAPIAGANAIITTALALWVQAGNVLFAGALTVSGVITVAGGATFLTTTTTLTNNAAAQTATLLNGPTAGNPTKWVAVNDAGTTRFMPLW